MVSLEGGGRSSLVGSYLPSLVFLKRSNEVNLQPLLICAQWKTMNLIQLCVCVFYLSSRGLSLHFRFQNRALPVRSVPHCKKIPTSLCAFFLFFFRWGTASLNRFLYGTLTRPADTHTLSPPACSDLTLTPTQTDAFTASESCPFSMKVNMNATYLWGPEGTRRRPILG